MARRQRKAIKSEINIVPFFGCAFSFSVNFYGNRPYY